ncbi:MAG: hypothetical protein ACE5E6_06500 [Phycisphaerae bacterium]
MVRGRAVAISIVALHVLIGIWVIGVVRPETFRYRDFGDATSLLLFFDGGLARLTCWVSTDPPADTFQTGFELYGFGMEAAANITPTNKVNRKYRVMLPIWALLGTCMFYPALAFFRGPFTRMRRRRLNRCVPCGYSLIGNTSGVCPECGSIIPTRANRRSYERWTCAIEVKLWQSLDRLTVRRVGLALVVLVLLAIGVDMLRGRPWENATTRAYRVCQADGLSRKQIESDILMIGAGLSPGTQSLTLHMNTLPINTQLMNAPLTTTFSSPSTGRSQECLAAMQDAAKASPAPVPTPVWSPAPYSKNPIAPG